MAATRKVFIRTDLSIPVVEHIQPKADATGSLAAISPSNTIVRFGKAIAKRSFDFSPWYGVGIDQITYAYQMQIERFLAKQDLELAPSTVASYCHGGGRQLLDYLVLRSAALQRDLTLGDVDRELIDGFLSSFDGEDCSMSTKANRYQAVKAVLKSLCKRGFIVEVHAGDDATFPSNPFPGKDKSHKGAAPLGTAERKAFSTALRQAVVPLFEKDVEPTADLLAYALFVIALHTGRNTTPLLEMSRDCLRAHPKVDTVFLVLFKRRGHSTHKAALRNGPETLESVPTLRPTVAQLVRRLIELSARLQSAAPKEFSDRVFLFRTQRAGRGGGSAGDVSALSEARCSWQYENWSSALI
ncbi:hypothetical protein QTI51_22870 [Variovorax sp. J22G73]|uniref:hypothetical protein n=1 Tax=unclassified Variovorax TaxID=663243 RepID=UPI0025769839|nr:MULTISPECIES: hypothetical protein [unclassified Variovorax]MDM0007492.1 hypothetical protein [Variovorax sp. J22R203]MDM0100148.1 hypothetical protein [Variovorax sp. J22G73]